MYICVGEQNAKCTVTQVETVSAQHGSLLCLIMFLICK